MTSNLASREIAAHALQLRREAKKAVEKAKSTEGMRLNYWCAHYLAYYCFI